MSKARDYLLAALVLLVGRRREKAPRRARIVPPGTPNPRAESAAIAAALRSARSARVGFVVVYAIDAIPHQTQLLGLALGLALALHRRRRS